MQFLLGHSAKIGRMKYTLGDTGGAVQLFLGLLQYSSQTNARETDSVVIDDIRQSLEVRNYLY